MPQKPIELILLMEFARQLAMAVTIVDNEGTVIFYNEPAEKLVGLRFEETGEIPLSRYRESFRPVDSDGLPIPLERLPIGVALHERRAKQDTLWAHEADGTAHLIATTSIPIDGQGGTPLGAMAIFWEVDPVTFQPEVR